MQSPFIPPRPWYQDEPSLHELLSDPACHLLMRRDGTTPQMVEDLLDRLRGRPGTVARVA